MNFQMYPVAYPITAYPIATYAHLPYHNINHSNIVSNVSNGTVLWSVNTIEHWRSTKCCGMAGLVSKAPVPSKLDQ